MQASPEPSSRLKALVLLRRKPSVALAAKSLSNARDYRLVGPSRAGTSQKTFRIVLIKPSHYDADGYVIQWLRSTIPSNSLASVHGLLAECGAARVLGPDVDVVVEPIDECNTVIKVPRIIRAIKAADAGFVGLVGVQSNQFPRALEAEGASGGGRDRVTFGTIRPRPPAGRAAQAP